MCGHPGLGFQMQALELEARKATHAKRHRSRHPVLSCTRGDDHNNASLILFGSVPSRH
jgi:hypothetical protein